MESILTSIKKLIGITEDYTQFDADIVMHINTVLMDLTNLGVGPAKGFIIEDSSSYWTDFVSDPEALQAIKSYMYLRVKLLFDPPSASYLIESMQRQIDKFEWLINVTVENSKAGIVDDATAEELRAMIAELEEENLALKESNARLEKSNAAFEVENDELADRVSTLENTNHNLQVRVNSLEEFSTELQENINGLENENSELRTTVSDLEQDKAVLESRAEELEAENATLETNNAELTANNETLQNANSELEAENETLETRVDELQASIKPEQRKTVEITENGTTEILPDNGNTLSGVDLTVNVPSSGDDNPLKYMTMSYTYGFRGVTFPDDYHLIYRILGNATSINYGYWFAYTNVKKITLHMSVVPENLSFANAFMGSSKLTEIVLENKVISITSLYSAFSDCTSLETISGTLDALKCTTYGNAFSKCYALREIRFAENSINVSLGFGHSGALSDESIQNIIDGLATVETTQKLTLLSTVVTKLTDEQLLTIASKNWEVG